jgi:hypothetical protein
MLESVNVSPPPFLPEQSVIGIIHPTIDSFLFGSFVKQFIGIFIIGM